MLMSSPLVQAALGQVASQAQGSWAAGCRGWGIRPCGVGTSEISSQNSDFGGGGEMLRQRWPVRVVSRTLPLGSAAVVQPGDCLARLQASQNPWPLMGLVGPPSAYGMM